MCKFVDPIMLNDHTLVVWCESHEEFVTVYPDHYVAEDVA